MPWRVLSVRGYFLTIVTLALLAAFVLVVDLTTQQRRQLTNAAGQNAFQLARLAAGAHEHALAEAQQTLELLARMPAVRTGEGCGALLAELRRRMPRYLDLGVTRPDGEVLCRAQAGAGRLSVADRAWFRSAAEWRQPGVGEYHVERATGRSAVTVALPVLDLRGRLPAVVFAVLDLAWLGELATVAGLPEDTLTVLIDRDGFVLARHPVAEPTRVDARLVTALSATGSGVVELDALDARPRLLGFTRVGPRDGAGAYVVVGVPTPSVVAAGRALADGVTWIALIGVLGLVATVIGSEMLLRRRIEHLVATTRALAAGDFSARTGWGDTTSELGQVARAFDEMAAAIEGLTRRTELILAAVSEAIVGVDGAEGVTFVNPGAATLLGLPTTGVVGRSLHGMLRKAAASGGCPLCEALERCETQQSSDGVLTRPDGSVVPVEYVCTPKRDGGRAAGAVVALKDISQRKRAEQDRQRRRDMLHQRDKLASMATLLADVAHELNNPLTVIVAGATLLRDATRDESIRRRAELLEQAAERCALTIRNFLALVRQVPGHARGGVPGAHRQGDAGAGGLPARGGRGHRRRRAAGRAAAGVGRSPPAPPGAAQPRHQRAPRAAHHAAAAAAVDRAAPRHRGAQRGGGGRRLGARRAARAARLRVPAVLHDQVTRGGHRPRPGALPRHRGGARRHHPRGQRPDGGALFVVELPIDRQDEVTVTPAATTRARRARAACWWWTMTWSSPPCWRPRSAPITTRSRWPPTARRRWPHWAGAISTSS
jgi:PAS domain S-box-containing protein